MDEDLPRKPGEGVRAGGFDESDESDGEDHDDPYEDGGEAEDEGGGEVVAGQYMEGKQRVWGAEGRFEGRVVREGTVEVARRQARFSFGAASYDVVVSTTKGALDAAGKGRPTGFIKDSFPAKRSLRGVFVDTPPS